MCARGDVSPTARSVQAHISYCSSASRVPRPASASRVRSPSPGDFNNLHEGRGVLECFPAVWRLWMVLDHLGKFLGSSWHDFGTFFKVRGRPWGHLKNEGVGMSKRRPGTF